MSLESEYSDLKKFITFYLNDPNPDLKDLVKSQKHIKKYRNQQMDNLSMKDSRILHMSVLLYRFKTELEVGELFWKITRNMILAVLTRNPEAKTTISEYLKHFEIWKNDDLNKLILDVAPVYYNILEVKKSLGPDHVDIIHIDHTLELIKTECERIGIFEKVLRAVGEIIIKKNKLITQEVIRIYWDKIEEDISNNEFNIILENLTELKNQMKLILPEKEKTKPNYLLDECLDVGFYKHMINYKVFNKSNVKNILNTVIMFLKEWDSAEFMQIYDTEHIKISDLIENESFAKSLRVVLEYSTEAVSNLILRKETWKKLLDIKN